MNKFCSFLRLWGYILVAVFLFSCSGGFSIADLQEHLSNERVFARSGDFSALVPKDWLPVTENKNNSANLWFVKKDYSETISINKIIIPQGIGYEEIFTVAVNYRKINYGGELKELKKFDVEIDGKKIKAFSYEDAEGKNVFVYLSAMKNFFLETVFSSNENEQSLVALAVVGSLKTN